MKKTFLAIVALFAGYSIFAQSEITIEAGGTKIVKGFMSRQELASDSSFKWYAENQKGYTPDVNALNSLRANKDSVNFVVFGGTWCGDTKYILPKFFSLTDAAGFSQDRVTMIGVDRSKKTIQHLAEAFGVINVPTIIVMKNGKEVGRVVEYGKYGSYDKELAEILTKK
jgi:thiol-disulfide isomerase/thioredoxin